MSLLMQALKKAEQTKQKQQSDAVLSLSPTDAHAEPSLPTIAETDAHTTHAIQNEQATLAMSLHDTSAPTQAPVEAVPTFAPVSDAVLDNQFIGTPAAARPVVNETTINTEHSQTLEERISRPRIDIEQVKASANANQAQAAEQQKAKAVFSSKSPQVQHRRLWIFGIGGVALVMLTGFAYVFWQSSQIENRYSQIAQIPVNPAPQPAPVIAPPAPASVAVVGDTNSSAMTIASSTMTSVSPPTSVTPSDNKNADTKSELKSTSSKVDDNQRATISAKIPKSAEQAEQNTSNNGGKSATAQSQLAKEAQGIHIRKGSSDAQIHPALSSAYQAFLAGDSVKAEQQYQLVLNQEANNRDALIGLAAIALNQRNADKAGAYYGKLLELDPNDPDAIAGLTSLQQGDPVQSESRLKKALNQHPNAGAILFALGNLYAQQTRWSDAQQSYFRAYTTQPSNADYAYNLAISLDRLNQAKLAKEYYQRALEASQSGPGNFNRGSVQKRISELDKAVNDK